MPFNRSVIEEVGEQENECKLESLHSIEYFFLSPTLMVAMVIFKSLSSELLISLWV